MTFSRSAYRTAVGVIVGIAIAVALAVGLVNATHEPARPNVAPNIEADRKMATKYVGLWVTLDGNVRHELLPNGRYDEARGKRKSAYQGRYEIHGTHIDYWDDTGFTADGTFVSDDELHHGGMIFHRVRSRVQ